MKIMIITIIKMPFVITDVKKPTSEPIPTLIACLNSVRLTINSAKIAPKKDRVKFPRLE